MSFNVGGGPENAVTGLHRLVEWLSEVESGIEKAGEPGEDMHEEAVLDPAY